MRTRSHSPAARGPGLSQIAVRHARADRTRGRARRAGASGPRRRRGRARVPAAAARSATAREWPSVNGDLRSTKLAIASSAASNCSSDSTTVSAGSASMTAAQRPARVEVAEDVRRHRRRGSSASAGSNCVPARRAASARAASTPWTRCATSTYSASMRDPRRDRDVLARQRPRPALAVPLLVGRAERGAGRRPERPSSSASIRASLAWRAIMPSRS